MSCVTKKGEWIYILSKKIKNYTKDFTKLLKIIVIAFLIIFAIVLIKYKPVYRVTISGEEVGYVLNKKQFEELVNNEIVNPSDANIAYVDMKAMPEYELSLGNIEVTNEEVVFNKIQDLAVVTYKLYAIAVNGEKATYVNSKNEAEETVAKIKEEYKQKLDEIDIVVTEEYTTDLNSITSVGTEVALANAKTKVTQKVEEIKKIKASTFEGVYFEVRPVSGVITSRFGATESIRTHSHKGIDIGAPNGTPIKAAAGGKVSYSGWMGGYGNLVIIDHGNGIQTYYAHCSKLYVEKGEEVEAGHLIGAVGSTGFSTGNHLHFEIRKNGSQINPQRYVYR